MSYTWGAGPGVGSVVGTAAVRGAVRTAAPAPAGGRPRLAAAAPVVEPGPPEPARGPDLRRLAAELAPMVEVWQRLMHDHVPDRGGRCRTCTKGGTGLPSTPWPCSIYGIADLARRHGER